MQIFLVSSGMVLVELRSRPQSVILYTTLKITPPKPYKRLRSMPTKGSDSPARKASTLGRIQSPAPERLSPRSHHKSAETGNSIPQSREEMSPTRALHRTNDAMKRIVRSNTWERAVERINWVMDSLSPIAEVRVIPY